MKLSPEDTAIVRQAIGRVRDRAASLDTVEDVEAAVACLRAIRDAALSAESRIQILAKQARARALDKLEQA